MKTGYSIKTWKMRLFCPEKQMIETTEALYQEAVAFYYELLKEREELWAENLLTIQGHLEKLTVPGRDGREPKYIPPGGKLPVYFRRSAMNKATMAVKTAASAESFPEKIDANITFFKGMYRDLTDTSVVLKLWNGKKWIWVSCGLTGRPFPKEAALLSPTLVHEEKWLMFHVPVKQENSDARTAKERMQEGARVCSVRFTNTDSFAVCTVLDEGSRQLAVKNCRGGNAYRHHCKALLKKVEASRAFTDKDNVSQPNRKYYMHLKHLNEHYAHQVSNDALRRCCELIIKKDKTYEKIINRLLRQNYYHCFNMFYCKKELMNEYCQWLFEILFDFEKKIDITEWSAQQQRVYGFIAEFLMNVWIEKKGLIVKEIDVAQSEEFPAPMTTNAEINVINPNFLKKILYKLLPIVWPLFSKRLIRKSVKGEK